MGKDNVSRAFDILEELLGDRRIRESATFSTRTYSDQPIIQTGRQLRERMDIVNKMLDTAGVHSATLIACQSEAGN